MATCAMPAFVDRLLTGVDVLVHMAGTSVERPLPEIIENNLRGLHAVYEGARRHRVRAHRVRQFQPRRRHAQRRHANSTSTAICAPTGSMA